jgi:adenylylsulfate kinase-like enzyme
MQSDAFNLTSEPAFDLLSEDIPLVIVSGLPASGKTTLARKLAPALSLSLLDKDDILEGLFEALGIGDAYWRQRLSRASDEIFERLAKTSSGAVLTSFWRHSQMPSDSGTPVDWLVSTSQRIVEVYCVCDPDVAATRFIKRVRHPGHLDSAKQLEDVLANFRTLATMGPLGIGKLIRVDTSNDIDFNRVVRDVKTLLNHI